MKIQCEHCKEVFEVPDIDVDAEVGCPHCNSQITDIPIVEFEGCSQCMKSADKEGIEYTQDATWKDGAWHCDHCGGIS